MWGTTGAKKDMSDQLFHHHPLAIAFSKEKMLKIDAVGFETDIEIRSPKSWGEGK